MEKVSVYLEIGQKKTFAGMLDWPGWSRSGKTAEEALLALVDYAPRYLKALANTSFTIPQPETPSDLEIATSLEGSSTTDFGAPGAIPPADQIPLDQKAFERSSAIIEACWKTFAKVLAKSEGIELRTGPRGGGRAQKKIAGHVIDSHRNYLRKIGWNHAANSTLSLDAQLDAIQEATSQALTAAFNGELPETGPRGGKLWPPRYFLRRAAWHILDHAWEIEDRGDLL